MKIGAFDALYAINKTEKTAEIDKKLILRCVKLKKKDYLKHENSTAFWQKQYLSRL